MINLKTLLYLVPTYELIQLTYHRKNKPAIEETAIKDDLIKESYVMDYIVTSVYSSKNILHINCEERRKTCKVKNI